MNKGWTCNCIIGNNLIYPRWLYSQIIHGWDAGEDIHQYGLKEMPLTNVNISMNSGIEGMYLCCC
jgi:hypothetical protein